MNLRPAKYLIPNALTMASICAGVNSIHVSTTAQSPSELRVAGWLIVAAMICDVFDGRIARTIRARSKFGARLDSLADGVSFGVAPAFLLYHWGLSEWWDGAVLFVGLYAGCALIRLARFHSFENQRRRREPRQYFVGLATPVAASVAVSIVLAELADPEVVIFRAGLPVAVLAVGLAGLMISRFEYRTFKTIRLQKTAGWGVVGVVGAVVSATIWESPALVFALMMGGYAGSGPVVWLFSSRDSSSMSGPTTKRDGERRT